MKLFVSVAALFLFCIAVLCMWVMVLRLLSFLGGWASLANDFREKNDAPVKWKRFQTIWLQGVCYSSCVQIAEGNDALFLRPEFPFRPGHESLEIPFSDLEYARDSMWGGKMFFDLPKAGFHIKIKRRSLSESAISKIKKIEA